jgi:hypothetical protein
MDADLDLLLIAVFCTADDLLPDRAKNAKRSVTDAEVITLYGKRRHRLADTIEALIGQFAAQSPGFYDDLLVVDSTPVECARSLETVRRSQLADAADYGLRQPQPLLLGLPAPRPVRTGRHPPRDRANQPQDRQARGLPQARRPLPAHRAAHRDRRQGLHQPRLPRRDARSRRTHPPPTPQGRTRHRPTPRADPTDDRIDLSKPSKTSSHSNATAPAPSTDSAPASANASSPSPPASPSTTNSAAQAATSPPTPPNNAELLI